MPANQLASTVLPAIAARRHYQFHRATTKTRLAALRAHYTASELAQLLGLRSARQVRDLCAAWGIRKWAT